MPLFSNGETDLPDKGIRAEDMFLRWLGTCPDVISAAIEDVRLNPMWMSREVDFIVHYADGSVVRFEVKFDERAADTGNLYTEYARVYRGEPTHRMKPGWNLFTWADRIAVWVPTAHAFYFYGPIQMLLAWRKTVLSGKWPSSYRSDNNCVTWSLYVPMDFIDGLEVVPFDPDANPPEYVALSDMPF